MNVKDQLEKAVDEHGEKIGDAAEKAGNLINDKTGGKYADQIDSAVGKAKDALDGLDGKNDDIGASSDPADTPPAPDSAPDTSPAPDSTPPLPEPDVQPSSTPDGPQTIPVPGTPPGEPGPDAQPLPSDTFDTGNNTNSVDSPDGNLPPADAGSSSMDSGEQP